MTDQFADIRPYHDSEVRPVLERLLADNEFILTLGRLRLPNNASRFPGVVRLLVRWILRRELRGVSDVRSLQHVVKKYMDRMIEGTTDQRGARERGGRRGGLVALREANALLVHDLHPAGSRALRRLDGEIEHVLGASFDEQRPRARVLREHLCAAHECAFAAVEEDRDQTRRAIQRSCARNVRRARRRNRQQHERRGKHGRNDRRDCDEDAPRQLRPRPAFARSGQPARRTNRHRVSDRR